MTPEYLEGIRQDVSAHYAGAVMVDGGVRFDLLDPKYRTQADLIAYIDILHEDLRLTRAERDAEKKKRAQQAKDHAAEVLAWDALAVDTRAKAWDEGYVDGWLDNENHRNTTNPYRKDRS